MTTLRKNFNLYYTFTSKANFRRVYQVYLVKKIDYFFLCFYFVISYRRDLFFSLKFCFSKNLVGNFKGQRINLKSNTKPTEKLTEIKAFWLWNLRRQSESRSLKRSRHDAFYFVIYCHTYWTCLYLLYTWK